MTDTMATNWNKNETRLGEMRETAKGATSNLADKAEGLMSSAGEKADDAASAVGGCMTSFSHTIHEIAPEEGVLGIVSAKAAETFDTAGRYLKEEGVTGMAEEMTNLIRRNPVPALLLGLGVGFLLARATRR